jgi:ribosomal protein S18 acetylase RimI-like enzyme
VPGIVELNAALFQEDAGQRDPFMNLNWPKEEGHVYFRQHVLSDTSIVLLVEKKRRIIAYLLGYTIGSSKLRPVRTAELESMYVKPEYRSQRIGQQLVRTFLEWAQEQEAGRVTVMAYTANERAVFFYRKMGFLPKNITLELSLDHIEGID